MNFNYASIGSIKGGPPLVWIGVAGSKWKRPAPSCCRYRILPDYSFSKLNPERAVVFH